MTTTNDDDGDDTIMNGRNGIRTVFGPGRGASIQEVVPVRECESRAPFHQDDRKGTLRRTVDGRLCDPPVRRISKRKDETGVVLIRIHALRMEGRMEGRMDETKDENRIKTGRRYGRKEGRKEGKKERLKERLKE
jgi:hypothetical protein